MGGGLMGFYVVGWGQVRRGLARQPEARTRHLDPTRRSEVRGVRACERAQRVGACLMAGRGSRACAAEGRGQVVLARSGGCVRACECVETGR